MCCHSNHPKQGAHHCHGTGMHGNNPLLWSRKKRREMLEHYRKCLQEQLEDVEEAIREMDEEKQKYEAPEVIKGGLQCLNFFLNCCFFWHKLQMTKNKLQINSKVKKTNSKHFRRSVSYFDYLYFWSLKFGIYLFFEI